MIHLKNIAALRITDYVIDAHHKQGTYFVFIFIIYFTEML